MPKEIGSIEPDRVALAMCALIAADRQERAGADDTRTAEDILGAVGFEVGEVYAIVGGNYNTVKTRVQKARKKK
jgi:hypothetical protein